MIHSHACSRYWILPAKRNILHCEINGLETARVLYWFTALRRGHPFQEYGSSSTRYRESRNRQVLDRQLVLLISRHPSPNRPLSAATMRPLCWWATRATESLNERSLPKKEVPWLRTWAVTLSKPQQRIASTLRRLFMKSSDHCGANGKKRLSSDAARCTQEEMALTFREHREILRSTVLVQAKIERVAKSSVSYYDFRQLQPALAT